MKRRETFATRCASFSSLFHPSAMNHLRLSLFFLSSFQLCAPLGVIWITDGAVVPTSVDAAPDGQERTALSASRTPGVSTAPVPSHGRATASPPGAASPAPRNWTSVKNILPIHVRTARPVFRSIQQTVHSCASVHLVTRADFARKSKTQTLQFLILIDPPLTQFPNIAFGRRCGSMYMYSKGCFR